MSKPQLLLLQPLPAPIENALDAIYVTHRPPKDGRAAFIAKVSPEVRAVVTGGVLGASREFMESLPALGIVAVSGVGTDAVDLNYARSRGIQVTITPDVLTDDVADLAMGLMIDASRRIGEGDRFVRAGRWLTGALPLSHKISGKRLGIFGLGRIGRAVARRAIGFNMSIAYHSNHVAIDVPYRYVADLVQLARESDILAITVAGGAKSAKLVNQAVLEALGPDGILVNVARGSVVDEEALVIALTTGRLGGAGLDVFAREPHVPAALLTLDRVVLQPHRASATVETRLAMGELVLASLAAHFAGTEPPGLVK